LGGKYKFICQLPLAKAKVDRDAPVEGPFSGVDYFAYLLYGAYYTYQLFASTTFASFSLSMGFAIS
jgi:hypothetical protein